MVNHISHTLFHCQPRQLMTSVVPGLYQAKKQTPKVEKFCLLRNDNDDRSSSAKLIFKLKGKNK